MNWVYITLGSSVFTLFLGYFLGQKFALKNELHSNSNNCADIEKNRLEISQQEARIQELTESINRYAVLEKDAQKKYEREISQRKSALEQDYLQLKNEYEHDIMRLQTLKAHVRESLDSEKANILSEQQQQEKARLEALDQQLAERRRKCALLESDFAIRQNKFENDFSLRLKKLEDEKAFIRSLLSSNPATAPFFTKQFADYLYLQDLKDSEYLAFKKRPAITAAQKVREIAAQKRVLQEQCKLQEYQLNLYETAFPWLTDFKEISSEDLQQLTSAEVAPESEYASLKNWLSPQEYQSLPSADRLQLALERYSKRQKSNWQIGIEYERYVGYCYEKKGYRVRYNGATEGLEDMGRDLIISMGKKMYVIQCKRWASEKTIHEKHIFQLYGTTILQKMEHPDCYVGGLFITTTSLSDLAKDCAHYLNMTVVENFPMKDYPLIKCNISKSGEKIYHLPFDQQYDRVIINPSDGDFYASTVQEAEANGFRHAWRWSGA